MEAYSDILKSKIREPSFEFRKNSMIDFLKVPVRDYKESPTVKDYVEISDHELIKMATGGYRESSFDVPQGEEDIILKGNEYFVLKKNPLYEVDYLSSVFDKSPEIMNKITEFIGTEREEHLINSSWQGGIFIKTREDISLNIDIKSVLKAGESGAQKDFIWIGRNSKLVLSEERLSHGDGKGIQGRTIYFYLEEGANLDYHYLQDKNREVFDITFIKSFGEKNTLSTIYHVNHGGGKVLFQNDSNQMGNQADYRVYGVSFSAGKQKIDIRDSSFQQGVSSNADIHVRGIVTGESSTIHRGNIDIELLSTKSTGFYDSRIILLSKDGYANSKPALMIKNNDTRSKHGSAISNIDREELTYIRSRGIPEKEAKK
ncbi:FeS assembly protein SufD [mine drainage metagenome]|uniref:FeS assembly protein SufD n=1 Tax=mine drainage metagenome TaxID=410659 RepID=T1CF05_9ZZZZ